MNWSKFSLFIGLLPFFSLAQAPQKISYQAVIRNANNTVLISKPIGLKISVLNGASNPVAVYEEMQSTYTNAFGLINLQIGAGKVVSGEMSKINWAKGPYFIKTDIDPDGGSNYVLSGLTELTSVPYALFALTSGISQETVNGGGSVPGPQGERGLTGATGANGDLGVTGLTGAAGLKGVTGLTGAAGLNGATGLTGAAGPDGFAGPRGLTGLPGSAGAEGPRGLTGLTGAAGAVGLTGLSGSNGSNGAQGIPGTAGADGAPGAIGASGSTGAQGAAGTNGVDGAQGPTGLTGLSGSNGANGAQGIPGTNGSNGAQGPIGLTGARGLTGNAGNTGAAGTQGIQGNPGPQGNPGLDGHDQVKFNKRIEPISFEDSFTATTEEVFDSGIFIGYMKGKGINFTLPPIEHFLKILGEKATNGDVITILISSTDGITTIIPGNGGKIVGPATISTGLTRVVYIRFTIIDGMQEYFIY